jgi:hypothetical protein
MGAGDALQPLAQGQAPGHLRLRLAWLDQVAEALHRGDPVPPEATENFAEPLMPRWLYRVVGNAGWLYQAWTHGALLALGDQPLSASAAAPV